MTSWVDAAVARHTQNLTTAEFLKAVRALSIRYVERRAELTRRTPTDSPGKRAAFAGFFAPIHLLTTLAIARRLDIAAAGCAEIVDLGCGTGVCGAACALAVGSDIPITGIDQQAWSLDEARWNWGHLGVRGRTIKADLVERAERMAAMRAPPGPSPLVVLGWSVNELDTGSRARLRRALHALTGRGCSVLIVEPIARNVSPWWAEWATALASPHTREDDWRLDVPLPERLRVLDEAAGFARSALTARSLFYQHPAHERQR